MANRLTLGNLTIDRSTYEVVVADARVDVTFFEFELLFQLARNAGKVVARERLLETVWRGSPENDDDRRLTVHISRLRKKITASHPYRIKTTPKRGYSLANTTTSAASKSTANPGTPALALLERRGH